MPPAAKTPAKKKPSPRSFTKLGLKKTVLIKRLGKQEIMLVNSSQGEAFRFYGPAAELVECLAELTKRRASSLARLLQAVSDLPSAKLHSAARVKEVLQYLQKARLLEDA